MHLLSSHNRSEFLACPQLIRFEYGRGRDGFEPTLLIKSNTLLLKYVVLGAPMQLAFAMCGDRLLYALKVCDDGDGGGILWSVVERVEELNGIRGIVRDEPLVAFLFNELAVNVAWRNVSPSGAFDRLSMWVGSAALGRVDHAKIGPLVESLVDRLHEFGRGADEWVVLDIYGDSNWNPVHNHFITAGANLSLIDLFDGNEGGQQEQLGVWLTDNLRPSGVCHSPQVPKGNGTRELIDIIFGHEFGAVLIESKTISIFSRERLPNRVKLKRDVAGHVEKGFDQLRGAIRALKADVRVTNSRGDILSIERERPAHAIVLIPDLDLIEDRAAYGVDFIRDFLGATGGFPHLLDISELLRIVQAAGVIAGRSTNTTPMMAFDYYLMERAEMALTSETLCIEVLLRFEKESEQGRKAHTPL